MTVYLLHFDTPYKHARHYIGYCDDSNLEHRIEQHRNGTGARLMQIVALAKITFTVARTWPGQNKRFERRLKKCKKPLRFCPICNPSGLQNMVPEKLTERNKPHEPL